MYYIFINIRGIAYNTPRATAKILLPSMNNPLDNACLTQYI